MSDTLCVEGAGIPTAKCPGLWRAFGSGALARQQHTFHSILDSHIKVDQLVHSLSVTAWTTVASGVEIFDGAARPIHSW